MKTLIRASFLSIILLGAFLYGEGIKLNQEKGIWQDKKEKQIDFYKYEKVDFNFDTSPMKKVAKILLYKDNIYILDESRNELYVIDKKGGHVATVGRPGQGPGDIEFGWDFYITPDDKIYVLNALPKRVSVFDLKGKSLGTIKLQTPDLTTSLRSIAVDKNKNIIIGSAYNNIIAAYSPTGEYQKTLLKRKDIPTYTDSGIGIPSRLSMMDENILFLDLFKGVFVNLSKSGAIQDVFSAYSQILNDKVKELEEDPENAPQKGVATPRGQIIITLWTNFCIDQTGKIYVVPTGRKKGEVQKMYVYSPYGIFLYEKSLDYFVPSSVRHIGCEKDCFVFLTYNLDLILAYRRN